MNQGFLEKRKDFRWKVNPLLQLQINLSGRYRQAEKLDHADNGMAFKTDFDIKPGTLVYIRRESCPVNCPKGEACENCRMAALATIKWCRPPEGEAMKSYRLGVTYLNGIG